MVARFPNKVAVSVALLSSLAWVPQAPGQSRHQEKGQIEQVRVIDAMIEADWEAYQLSPSRAATDNEWCRRVFLDIIGRIPSVEELQEYLNDKSPDKARRLVETLLHDDRYTEEFSRNWTTLWSNLLIGRTGGNNNRSMIDRSGMQKYLRDTFARNKPYDRMVGELITATGTTRPGDPTFNGATNYLIDKINEENASQATAATSRIFLGMQVQCTQCHNHPFNDWKQRKYWELNAFFRQARARGGRRAAQMGQPAELVDVSFRGESQNIKEADLYYELRNGLLKVAYPVFIDGTEIDKHGDIQNVNRREELARLVVNSSNLELAMANRMWAHFMGYGFSNPVDDLGPHNPPSHPELLEYLAEQFRASDFDLRRLMTWIILSKPYSLSSRISSANEADDPQAGEAPRFSRFYLRQMRAEELYESLLIATHAHENGDGYEAQERRKNMWLQQFSQAFGTDEGDETTSFNGTIPQVLMMFNGDMIRQATNGAFLQELANSKLSGKQKIDKLFLAGLAREAKPSEMQIAQQLLAGRRGDPHAALQDVWWVILNSNEFIFNH